MNFLIEKSEDGTTVKSYLSSKAKISRRTLIALKKRPEGILLNGEHVTVRAILHGGDTLTIDLADETNEKIVPTALPLDILYEDDYLIAVNKPSGMPTHPSLHHEDDSLANALAFRYERLGVPFVFRPVNRLDLDTTGIVIAAKDQRSASLLSASMMRKEFEKHYIAVVHGRIEEDSGVIVKNIRRRLPSIIERETCGEEEGEYAETRFTVLKRGEDFTVIDANPVTGRTHQIRVHFASVGHPLVCDFLYGKEEFDLIGRQALHCGSLVFPHPQTGERLKAEAPLPPDMVSLIGKDKL